MFYRLYGVLLVMLSFLVEMVWLGLLMFSVVGGIVVLMMIPSWILKPFEYLYDRGFAYYTKAYTTEHHHVGR